MPLQTSDISTPVGDTLAERISALLTRLGSVTRSLSVRDFAQLLTSDVGRPVGGSTVHRWITGGAIPDAFDIVAIAKRAGVSVEDFMAGLSAPGVKRRSSTPKRRAAAKVPQVKSAPKSVTRPGESGAKPRRRTAG